MSEERTQRARRSSKAPSLAPLYGGVVVAIMAVVAVALAKKNDRAIEESKTPQTQESSPTGNPFSRSASPSSGSSKTGNPSAPDLLQSDVWISALETAEQATAKLREAREKRDAGDTEAYIDLGIEARALFNQALDDTVQWELDLIDAHGEDDPQLKKIASERAKWSKQRKELRHVDISRR